MGKPVIQIRELQQVGMVVGNLDEKMKAMWEAFGIGPWTVTIFKPGSFSEIRYNGKPSRSGLKVGIAKLANLEIELLEPIGEDNIYHEFIKKYGDCVHHFGWYVAETPEAFAEAVKAMEKAGFPDVWSGRGKNVLFAYFDTTKVFNSMIELTWRAPGATMPTSYIFP